MLPKKGRGIYTLIYEEELKWKRVPLLPLLVEPFVCLSTKPLQLSGKLSNWIEHFRISNGLEWGGFLCIVINKSSFNYFCFLRLKWPFLSFKIMQHSGFDCTYYNYCKVKAKQIFSSFATFLPSFPPSAKIGFCKNLEKKE